MTIAASNSVARTEPQITATGCGKWLVDTIMIAAETHKESKAMKSVSSFPAPELIGTFRTFGPFGPPYEVVEPIRPLPHGDWLIRVRLLETGEEAEYRYTRVVDDPKAA